MINYVNFMQNIVLAKKTEELEELSKKLGHDSVYLDKFVLAKADNKKELLKEVKLAKKKNLFVIYKPKTEEMLRFVIEKTQIDLVFGVELIHKKDSMHYVRSGIDQVIAKIVAEKDKIIAFSFCDILNSKNKAKIMARMMLNIKVCKKYKVKFEFLNLASKKEEFRSKKDLKAFFRILGGN